MNIYLRLKELSSLAKQGLNRRGMVLLETELGAQRILGMLEGEHLPRIC